MDIKQILTPIAVLGGLGIIFAAFLSFASRVFHVKVDRRVAAVREALPGANCGACGYPGCDGLAEQIALHDGPVNGCPVGGASVAEAIAEIMGKTAVAEDKKVACVLCQGNNERAKNRFDYDGIDSCDSANALHGGQKACGYGCLGFGDCYKVCGFGAIRIENGLAIIDPEKCTSCGLCIDACPKHIIEFVPYEQKYIVKCKSHDNGKDTRAKCAVGCIGCSICVRQSEPGTYEVDNFLAHYCSGSGLDGSTGMMKCPTKAIYPGLIERKEAPKPPKKTPEEIAAAKAKAAEAAAAKAAAAEAPAEEAKVSQDSEQEA